MSNLGPSSCFKASVSAGALALGLLSSPAMAQDAGACGSPVEGVVDCDHSDGPFPNGVAYESVGDISINLADGLSIEPDAGHSGLIVLSGKGSVTISGGGASIASNNAGAVGAFAGGDINIEIGNVDVAGSGASGITTYSYLGDTRIDVGGVTTAGDYALGIVAESGVGNIAISAGNISTSGFASDAITATTGGDIEISADNIKGEGNFLWGVNSFSGNYTDGQILDGNSSIAVGSIEIAGDNAVGVNAVSYGKLDVRVDALEINGADGLGVRAGAIGDTRVQIGDANFTGENSGGIIGFSYGEARVEIGTLTAENGGGVVAYGIEGAYAKADRISISGNFANGIQSVSRFGEARLVVGEVSTNGEFAVAVNGDSGHGDVFIEAGSIRTTGYLAMGIRAFGKSTNIITTGPITTTGDLAFGMLNSTYRGDAVVRAAGLVRTSGDFADAMWITGRYGTADIRSDGRVSTSGDNAIAIRATGEDGQVDIVANEVETSGENSDGIRARTRFVGVFLGQPADPEPVEFTGDISIRAETVKAGGAGSRGITARGIGNAAIDAGTVSAFDGFAIETDMIEDSSITIRKAATSTQGSAIFAQAEDVLITVASGATVAGAEDGIIVSAVGERCVLRDPVDGSPNPCPNPGDDDPVGGPVSATAGGEPPSLTDDPAAWSAWQQRLARVNLAGGASVDQDPVARQLGAIDGTATIINAGTIKGGTGYAVRVNAGSLTLDNKGVLLGAVLLGDGDDVINNTGTFEISGNSDFGAGTDLFNNMGTVKFAAATTARNYGFLNLEEFRNSAKLDLRNGVAGDVFTLSGTYIGSGGAILGLDVDFADDKADKLVVDGAATGSTDVVLALTADQARLTGGPGIALIEQGPGSSATAFRLADNSKDIGFIRYGLVYDSTARRYLLQGVAGAGAYRQFNAIEGAENSWHSSADSWRSNDAASRDALWADLGKNPPASSRLWGQLYGSHTSRDAETTENAIGDTQRIDYGYRQDRTGAQLGFDLAQIRRADSVFRLGATGGYSTSTLRSRSADERIRFETLNMGLYASAASGRLFGSLLAKFDRHDVEVDAETAGYSAELDGWTWGLEMEAGARFGNTGFFVEPVASLAWTRTNFDDLEGLGQVLDFEQANGLRGRLGARLGGRSRIGTGATLLFYASANAITDFGKSYRLTLASNGQREEISADRIDSFAEGVVGAAYLAPSGLETYVEGQGERGEDHDSIGGRVGIRLRF